MDESTSAYVYAIGVVGLQSVKIGWAKSPVARVTDLQTGCPLLLVLLYQFPTRRPIAIESALHEKFSGLRIRGEWFDIGPDAARVVRQACEEITADLPSTPLAAEAKQAALMPSEFFLADIYPWIMALPDTVEYVTKQQLCRELEATDNPFWHNRGDRMVDFPLRCIFKEEQGKKVRVAPIREAAEHLRNVRARRDPRVAAYFPPD